MKSGFAILTMATLFLGACTSGSYITSSYTDDIYFNPGSIPPPISMEKESVSKKEDAEKSARRMIISDIKENEEGSQTMSNYIFDATERDADALVYSMDQYDLYDSDTTVYYNDDDVKYVINNYYDGQSLDYAYRIRRFHRPYFYDPFYWDSWYYDPFYYDPWYYSSWYSPYWSYSMGWGSRWYSPYYSWGWGGYYSPYYYSPWYSPYYSYYGWGYPYNSWYGYGNIRYIDSENYRYGQRRSTNTSVMYGSDSGRRSTSSGVRASATETKSAHTDNSVRTEQSTHDSRRASSSSGVRSAQSVSGQRTPALNSVASEKRRSDANIGSSAHTQTYTRPGSTSATRTYTRPASSATTTPRVVTQSKSGSAAAPSTSTYNRTYRTNSTYNRSSGSSGSTNTYRTPSSVSTKSGSTYSAPSRGSSSGSYSAPRSSGSSGSYSSPSRSGGSGSSGGSRSSSSSSGRR